MGFDNDHTERMTEKEERMQKALDEAVGPVQELNTEEEKSEKGLGEVQERTKDNGRKVGNMAEAVEESVEEASVDTSQNENDESQVEEDVQKDKRINKPPNNRYSDGLFYDPEIMDDLGKALGMGVSFRGNNRLEFFLDYMTEMEDPTIIGEEIEESLFEGGEKFINEEGYRDLPKRFTKLKESKLVDEELPNSYRINAKASLFINEVVDPLLEYVNDDVESIIDEKKDEGLEEFDFNILEPDEDAVSVDYQKIVGVTEEEYNDIVSTRDIDRGACQEENIELVSEILSGIYKPTEVEPNGPGGNRAAVLMEYGKNKEVDRQKLKDAADYNSKTSVSSRLAKLNNDGFLKGEGKTKELSKLGEKVTECLESFYNEIEGYKQ